MTLEDFFTLTEMNNGLTSPSRVKELLSRMQKDRDSTLKNIGDAPRHWSAVANTIVATDNKDCLDLFTQLGGIWFINKWLQEAQKFSNDAIDSFVEESVTHLLRAIEKLGLDNEKSVSTGIRSTVQNFLCHKNSKVHDIARSLFDRWDTGKTDNAIPHQIEKAGTISAEVGPHLVGESGHLDSSSGEVPCRSPSIDKWEEPNRCGPTPSVNSDTDCSGSTKDKTFSGMSEKIRMTDDPADSVLHHSSTTAPCNENANVEVDSRSQCSEGTGATEPSKGDTIDGQADIAQLVSIDNLQQTGVAESSPPKSDAVEVSNQLKDESTSNVPNGDSLAPVVESTITGQNDSHDLEPSLTASAFHDFRTAVSETKNLGNNNGPNFCVQSSSLNTASNKFISSVLPESSSKKLNLEDSKETRLGSSGQDIRVINEPDVHASHRTRARAGNGYGSSKSKKSINIQNVVDKKSDIGLEYGMVDPLELARQVAIEVEREVEDFRDGSCSSSEEVLGERIGEPSSPESVSGNNCPRSESLTKASPAGTDMSEESSPTVQEPASSSGDLDSQPVNGTQEPESSQVTEAALELDATADKGFDLNQEICYEDMDNSITAPISVVSASRPVAAPGMPSAPLQFEGSRGWKGSAATSAFRPASPRRVPEGDKAPSTGGSSGSSKQQGYLDIDLNVAEAGDDRTDDPMPRKQVALSSGINSGESSVEVSPRRLERPELDLNRIGDDGEAPSEWPVDRQFFIQRSSLQTQSPSSSSSCRQSSLRNIDLNDQPSFLTDSSDHLCISKSVQNMNASGSRKSDDSVISIMGMRLEVNRKDFSAQSLLPNGRISEPAVDPYFARTGGILGMGSAIPYAHTSVFGYNGLPPGPAMPFSSAVYGTGGPIPYMVDSRGAPIIPQVMSSSSGLGPAFTQPPFMINMSSASSSNGAGPTRSTIDLNTRLMLDGGSRDTAGFRQLFGPSQTRSMDEHLRSNFQPSISSDVGLKRKEPDGGWEPYPFKHHTSPWK